MRFPKGRPMATQRGSHFPQPLFWLMVDLGHLEGPPVEFSKVAGAGPEDRSAHGNHPYLRAVAALTFVCSSGCLAVLVCSPYGFCGLNGLAAGSPMSLYLGRRSSPFREQIIKIFFFATGSAMTLGLFCDVG